MLPGDTLAGYQVLSPCGVQEQQNEIGRDLAALAQPGSGRDPRMQQPPAPAAEPNHADGDDEYDPEEGGMVF